VSDNFKLGSSVFLDAHGDLVLLVKHVHGFVTTLVGLDFAIGSSTVGVVATAIAVTAIAATAVAVTTIAATAIAAVAAIVAVATVAAVAAIAAAATIATAGVVARRPVVATARTCKATSVDKGVHLSICSMRTFTDPDDLKGIFQNVFAMASAWDIIVNEKLQEGIHTERAVGDVLTRSRLPFAESIDSVEGRGAIGTCMAGLSSTRLVFGMGASSFVHAKAHSERRLL